MACARPNQKRQTQPGEKEKVAERSEAQCDATIKGGPSRQSRQVSSTRKMKRARTRANESLEGNSKERGE